MLFSYKRSYFLENEDNIALIFGTGNSICPEECHRKTSLKETTTDLVC